MTRPASDTDSARTPQPLRILYLLVMVAAVFTIWRQTDAVRSTKNETLVNLEFGRGNRAVGCAVLRDHQDRSNNPTLYSDDSAAAYKTFCLDQEGPAR